ncbi:MAG: RNA polymerase sigma factor [Coraliomargaritaceae bacterium]
MKNESTNPDSIWMRSIIDQHAGDLTRYAASILQDPDAARDVVQTTFIRLWNQPRGSVEDHLRPWLFRVCRNRALDLRKKGLRMKPLDDTQVEKTPSGIPNPGENVEQKDSYEQVLGLIQKLPENQREVVRLKFQNDLSYKEIASITDLSVSNVGFLLHSALKTLRSQITPATE